jgi:hypothetical protein
MGALSLSEHVEQLLDRKVVEPRVGGAPAVASEATALFEGCSMALLLRPRAVLYLALLARNGLLQTLDTELQVLALLEQDIDDLDNPELRAIELRDLRRARTALLKLEQVERLSTLSGPYQQFHQAVDGFLQRGVQGVRGGNALDRPAPEAARAIPSDLQALKDQHSDLLDRLYALVVGVENFLSSPIGTLVSGSTLTRAREDLDTLLKGLSGDAQMGREQVLQLLTTRATLRTLGTLPDVTAPLVDTLQALPLGSRLRASSPPAQVDLLSAEGPFVLPPNAQVTVNGEGPHLIPQTDFDLGNRAALVGGMLPNEVSLDGTTSLYVLLKEGAVESRYKLGPLSAGTWTFPNLLVLLAQAIINASAGAHLGVTEFVRGGTRRLLLYAKTADKLLLQSFYLGPPVEAKSAHKVLGLPLFQEEVRGTTSIARLRAALGELFSDHVAVTGAGSRLQVQGLTTTPGTPLHITAPAVLGLSGEHVAMSREVLLSGLWEGAAVEHMNPSRLLGPGDLIELATGSASVQMCREDRVVLDQPLPSLSQGQGDVRVRSGLVLAYEKLNDPLQRFLTRWLEAPFAEDLSDLDAALATLGGLGNQTARNTARGILQQLRQSLEELRIVLTTPGTQLIPGMGQDERQVVETLLSALEERKFDRAVTQLLRCQVAEVLELNAETASYAGSFLKAASDLAQTDLTRPNLAEDEGLEAPHRRTL